MTISITYETNSKNWWKHNNKAKNFKLSWLEDQKYSQDNIDGFEVEIQRRYSLISTTETCYNNNKYSNNLILWNAEEITNITTECMFTCSSLD